MRKRGERRARPGVCSMSYSAPHFFSPGGGEYMGIGNCETLAPPSSAVILLTPCFFTSSMRSTECRAGRCASRPRTRP